MIKNYPTLKNLVPLFFFLSAFMAFSQNPQILTSVTGPVTVPPGVTQVTVEVWGGGGGGGASWNNTKTAGGGGGGAYTIAVIDGLVSGQVISYTVGSGGQGGWNPQNGADGGTTTFLSVKANGGKGGGGIQSNSSSAGNGGQGGTAETLPFGVISYSGGAGRSGVNSSGSGGGGGSSAGIGNPGTGTTATSAAGAIAPDGSEGGNGGNGYSPRTGDSPGGGGGGGPDSNGQGTGIPGGNGGSGQIRITWTYIDFIGTTNSDYVYFGNNHNFLATAPFSLEAWVLQTNNKTGTHTIISKGDAKAGSLRGYHLFLNDGKPTFTWYNNSGVPLPTISSPNAINDGKWHHISLTYNGSISKLYIDGLDVVPAGVAFASIATDTQPFLIGAMYDSSPATNPKNNFDGYIDEVRVWNVALTEQQIREMMNQRIIQNGTAVRGKTIPLDILGGLLWANLKGYYPMNDGPTSRDKSNNGKHGLIKNMFTNQPNTAPLPYKSIAGGNWETLTTWDNNNVQYLPNTTINGKKISWNIVETAHNITSGNRDITVLGLISTAGKLTIQDTGDIAPVRAGTGQGLWITHYLKLNGVIDLVGESQLVQKRYGVYDSNPPYNFITTQLSESEFDATSTGSIEIDQQGTGDSFNYNYWSSPVNSNFAAKTYSIGDVLRDGNGGTLLNKNIDFGAPYAFADIAKVGAENIKLSTYWMYKLENSKGYAAWTRIRDNISIKVGEGYTMKGSNTTDLMQNYTFVGKPNNGDITLPITIGNDYLVGNPYPSAIDVWEFIDDNLTDITGPLYFWEHSGGGTHNLAGYQGGYATLTKAGGLPASTIGQVAGVGTALNANKIPRRFIPVGQAFFVVGDILGGSIKFNNSQRVFEKETNGYSIFMKSSNTKAKTSNTRGADLRPKFRIGFDAPKISHRQLLLTIDEKATPAFDKGYEAEIYEIFADDFYWMLDGKKYIIQATNNVGLNSEVPIGIQLSKTGIATVKIDELENVDDDTSIYLKDKLTGESFNMREKPVQLNLTAGKYAERFVLIFKTQKLMAEDVKAEIVIPAASQPIIEGIHVFMNNATGELQIKNNSTEEITSVALINAVGQTVKTWNSNFNIRTISLPLSTATGVYLVQITTKTGKTVKKISVE